MNALRMVSGPIVLAPVYGRTYRSAEELRAAWEAGKDFRFMGTGTQTSIRDLKSLQANSSSITISDFVTRINIIVG